MQTVSYRDNLHEMSNSIVWEKQENIILSSAELAQRVVKVIAAELLYFGHLSESHFLLGALLRRSKFANFCYDSM